MVKQFRSEYQNLFGYPAPTEKWTEKDLWEWVDAGKPGNPPWNPDGIIITGGSPEERAKMEQIIDASGNRDMYELFKLGKPGSVKRSVHEAGMQTRSTFLRQQRNRKIAIAAAVGLGILALLGMG